MTRTRLSCFFCNEPIRKSDHDHGEQTIVNYGSSNIERAWHNACAPTYAPPDTPLAAAIRKADSAIRDARRLHEADYMEFRAVVEEKLALADDRPF